MELKDVVISLAGDYGLKLLPTVHGPDAYMIVRGPNSWWIEITGASVRIANARYEPTKVKVLSIHGNEWKSLNPPGRAPININFSYPGSLDALKNIFTDLAEWPAY